MIAPALVPATLTQRPIACSCSANPSSAPASASPLDAAALEDARRPLRSRSSVMSYHKAAAVCPPRPQDAQGRGATPRAGVLIRTGLPRDDRRATDEQRHVSRQGSQARDDPHCLRELVLVGSGVEVAVDSAYQASGADSPLIGLVA